MKPDSSLDQKLDELADGLDAGWDIPEDATRSLTPHSTPLPAALDELDANWDIAQPRSKQARSKQPRSSQARSNPTRPITAAVSGAVPIRATKQERRDAERKRRAHEAQQKSARKQERKAERREEAQKAGELRHHAEQRALAVRRANQEDAPKQVKPKVKAAAPAKTPDRAAKRVRQERTRSLQAAPVAESLETRKPAPSVPAERGAKKLILPLLIAILVAVTLGFALSRAR